MSYLSKLPLLTGLSSFGIGLIIGIACRNGPDVGLDRQVETSALKQEVDRLRARVFMHTASDFERANGLTAGFNNCGERGDHWECTALTGTKTIVSYHCTIDRCVMDCSK